MYKQLEEENKNLTKCNLNLQEWLDNKEKVNKSLREELSKKSMEVWFDKKAKNIFIDKSWKVIKGWEFTTLC